MRMAESLVEEEVRLTIKEARLGIKFEFVEVVDGEKPLMTSEKNEKSMEKRMQVHETKQSDVQASSRDGGQIGISGTDQPHNDATKRL